MMITLIVKIKAIRKIISATSYNITISFSMIEKTPGKQSVLHLAAIPSNTSGVGYHP